MYRSSGDVAVFGLDMQCRAITAVVDEGHHLFLLGTISSRGKNQIYLLEYKEDTSFCECLATWSHPPEIWSIASCPAASQKDLFITTHTNPSGDRTATVWSKAKGTTQGLTKVLPLTIPVNKALWDPQGAEVSTAVCLADTSLHVVKLDAEGNVNLTIPIPAMVNSGARDPHHQEVVAVVADGDLLKADTRQKNAITLVEHAHTVARDVQYNPNKQYNLATCGDDGCMKFWDVRNPSESLKVIVAHDHWVTALHYNPYHEQLVLSASTDRDEAVKLWNLPATSFETPQEKSTDGLLQCISDYDDSVYAVTWSSLPWVFASVSYSGKVMVHQVPRDTKYSILLSTE